MVLLVLFTVVDFDVESLVMKYVLSTIIPPVVFFVCADTVLSPLTVDEFLQFPPHVPAQPVLQPESHKAKQSAQDTEVYVVEAFAESLHVPVHPVLHLPPHAASHAKWHPSLHWK